MRYIKQILTALESDNGGNYHSLGAIHTGPTIIPEANDSRPGVDSTSGVIIFTIILLSSQYLYITILAIPVLVEVAVKGRRYIVRR